MKIISSQRYLDENVVAEKQAAAEYVVTLATVGEYRLVIDGHHSLEAARRDGVAPQYVESEYNYQAEADTIGIDDFLAAHWIDSDWYDIDSNNNVF